MKKSSKQPVNQDIRAKEVRLIGAEGEQLGVVPIQEALSAAKEAGLDLVGMSMQTSPPVCKIMDYGKHLYDQSKKKKKSRSMQNKEVKFRPGTEEADFKVKCNKASKFLERGDRVVITIRFRGREMMHKELGMTLAHRVETELAEVATVEAPAKFAGRQITMVLVPKR